MLAIGLILIYEVYASVIGNNRCPMRVSALLLAITAVSAAGACSIGDLQSGISILTRGVDQRVVKQQMSGSIPTGIKERLGDSKRAFLENAGQWDRHAQFVSQHPGMSVWASSDGLRYEYFVDTKSGDKTIRKGHVIGLTFDGAKDVMWKGEEKLPTITQFLRGKSKESVKTASSYTELKREGLYPGIDMRVYNDATLPRYDFIVAPGADPAAIKINFKGTKSIKLQEDGDLAVATSLGILEQKGLKAYQIVNGKENIVPVRFNLLGGTKVGFTLGAYDHSQPLVIDPIVYGSYYGGDGGIDEVRAVTSDADAGVYLTGATQAPDFPILFGPFSVNITGASDMFLAKLRGDAYVHEYSAYIGGSGRETGKFLGIDPSGNSVWIAGVTTSADFPLAASGLQGALAGSKDNFVMRFDRDAVTVLAPIYSTYYGGAGATEELTGFSIAPISGDLVLSGHANATVPSAGALPAGSTQAHYIARLNPTGTAILWAKFHGGTGAQFSGLAGGLVPSLNNGLTGKENDPTSQLTGSSVVVDASDNVLITGSVLFTGNQDTAIAASPGYPTTAGVFATGRLLRNNDAYMAKFDPNGNVTYSAILGGANSDFGAAITVDASGNAYLTGIAGSFDFPRTNGTFGQTFTNNANVFVTKVSTDGSQILISTNLRTTGNVIPMGIGVSQRGLIFVGGLVDCAITFPVPAADPNVPNSSTTGTVQTQDPIRAANTFPATPDLPATDGFLNVLDNTAATLVFGTYIGGNLDEMVFSPFVDRIGDVWVMGSSDSARRYIRTASGGAQTLFQVTNGGLDAGFITALAFKSVIEPALGAGATTFNSVPYGIRESPFTGPATINGVLRDRDGFLIRFRLDIPLVTNLTLNPASIAGGLNDQTTGTITISGPAPAEGVDVVVSLNSTLAASFDPGSPVGQTTVTIAPGATTGTFTVFSSPVIDPTQVQVKAEYLGSFKIAQLTVNPWLSQLTLTPTTVPSGNQSIGRVTLFKAATEDVTVAISTDNPNLISFPNGSTVTVPAGQQSVNFPIQTSSVDTQQQGNISASFLGRTLIQNLIVKPAALSSLALNPNRVAGGGTTVATVTLDGNAPSTGAAVTITVPGNPLNIATVMPVVVTVPAGQRTATTNITTNLVAANTFSTIRATYNATVRDATLLIDNISLSNFTINPTSIQGGGSVQGTLVINQPAPPGGAYVTVSSANPEVLIPDEDPSAVGNQILVNANATTRTFNIGTSVVLAQVNAVVSASRGGAPINRNLTILPVDFTISVSPGNVLGGNPATLTITLTGVAPVGGVPIAISLGSVLPNPPDNSGAVLVNGGNPVVVTAGLTTKTFPITTSAVTQTDTVIITGTVGPNSHSANLQVRAPQVTALTFTPSVVRGLIQTSTMRVYLDGPAPVGGAAVSISKSPNAQIANIPSSVTVPAGQLWVDTVVTTNKVSRTLATNVQASYGGNISTATLTVTR